MSTFYDFNQRVHLRRDPSQYGLIGCGGYGDTYDAESRTQLVFWEHADADVVTSESVDDLMSVEEYRERRRLFFATMRHPEMKWVRECFMHLKHDAGIDWHTIKEIEIDPPRGYSWGSKSGWTMTTDAFVTILIDPARYDGIEDFTTIPRHDEKNPYCECYYCYDATMAKRRVEREYA